MTVKQIVSIIPPLIKYNMKIIFAGKFIWFLLAALSFFCFLMFRNAWDMQEVNEGVIYSMLLFPCLLLIFYPTVFGIQNDEDNRILEIIFGIPNYRYKVWGVRMLMIFLIVFVVLIAFAYLAAFMLFPLNPFEISSQLMFPVFFFGSLAFMLSTLIRSGNGTAVVMIIMWIAMLFLGNTFARNTFWDVFLNPFAVPEEIHPLIWETTVVKSRIFLLSATIVWLMIGSLNLQKREKFI